MGSIKSRELIAKASKDFELAKGYRQVRDFVTASLLYNKAVEKVLKAIYISKSKREPPANASISYLARHTEVPDEVSVYIASMEENSAIEDPADISELVETSSENSAEVKAYYMEGLVKRLLDSMQAYSKI
jgi:HEPN domain-containing protein